MRLSVILFLSLLYLATACRSSKSGGPLPLSRLQADSLFNRLCNQNLYDSALAVAQQYMEGMFALNLADSATSFAPVVYSRLSKQKQQQAKLAAYIFSKRRRVEVDTSALKKMYHLLSYEYGYHNYPGKYEPGYVEIAEYCISLPQRFHMLNPELNLSFIQNLGIICNILGDLKKANTYYNQVYRYDRQSGNSEFIAGSAINIGIYLNESNQPDSAISICTAALPLKGVRTDQKINLLVNIAEAWSQKNNAAKALQLLDKAHAIATDTVQVKQPAEQLTDIYRARCQAYFRAGNYTAGLEAARRALFWGMRFRNIYRHRVIGKILQQTARNHLHLNQPDSALWYYHQSLYTVAQTDSANLQSLPAIQELYAENTLMDALDGMADAWDDRYIINADPGCLQQALQCRQLAFETERKLLETFTYDEAMTALLRESKNRSRKAIINCYRLFGATQNNHWVEQALQVAEKSKAVVLLHSVKRNRALAGNTGADSLFARVQQLRYQELALQREMNLADGILNDSLNDLLQQVRNRYLVAESELNQQHPELKRSGMDSGAITLAGLQAKLLKPGACLLEFFEADTTTCAIWMMANGQNGIYMPGSRIQDAVKTYAASLTSPDAFNGNTAAFMNTAARCSQQLLPPPLVQALQNGACSQLIVIPDGRTSQLPVDALALKKTGEEPRFLIEYATVNTGYSLSTLLTNLDGQRPFNTRSLAVFTPFSRSGYAGLPRLSKTKEEAEAIKQQMAGCEWYDDTSAGKTRFLSSLREAGIIHIASHAVAMDSLPPRIYLYADSISMPELYAAATRAGLVVLSACQTGAGDIDMNEGPLSLSRAFYYAGAGNVINSLWQVDDIANARIFAYFYKAFPATGAAAALRHAKLQYLQAADPSRRAPYYWAGMVHAGLEDMNTGNNKKKYWWAGIIAALAAIAGLLYYNRRKRRNRQ